jgi:hypothetical protein
MHVVTRILILVAVAAALLLSSGAGPTSPHIELVTNPPVCC